MTKIVSFTAQTLPALTEEQGARLNALMERPESEIDYSDIPPLSDDFWKKAVRGRFYERTRRRSGG